MKKIILLLGTVALMLTECVECKTEETISESFKLVTGGIYTKTVIKHKGHSYLVISNNKNYAITTSHDENCECKEQTHVKETEEYDYNY